jgi:hypothetical protein
MEESVGVLVLEEVAPPPHAVRKTNTPIAAKPRMIRRMPCLRFEEEQSTDQRRVGNTLIVGSLVFDDADADLLKWNNFS